MQGRLNPRSIAESYADLAGAICAQAVEDYRTAYKCTSTDTSDRRAFAGPSRSSSGASGSTSSWEARSAVKWSFRRCENNA